MVNTRRGTSGTNPSFHPNPPLEPNSPRETEQTTPQNLPLTLNMNAPGPSSGPQPSVTLTLAELQKYMMEWQKKAYAEARADLQLYGMAPPPESRAQPPESRAPPPGSRAPSVAAGVQTRPPPPTPNLRRQSAPRREGPTDSTDHTPRDQLEGEQRNRRAPSRNEDRARSLPLPVEEIAESTCREDERHKSPVRRNSPRISRQEPVNVRPELEEVSHQILRLSRKVEDLARGQNRAQTARDHQIRLPPQDLPYEEDRPKRDRASPFCNEIAMERMVGNNSIPATLPKYNGSTDPMQHILKFEHLMELHGYSSHIYAKVLVTTFLDLALDWFTRLEPGSIYSYEQLVEKFLHQFASKRRARMPHTALYSVKQGERETTRDFMERFNNEVLKVETPSIDFLLDVLIFALRNRPLSGALTRERPRTMERLLAICDSYVEEEEMNRLKYGVRDQRPKGKEKEPMSGRDGRRSPVRRFPTYTALNTTRKHVFLAIQHDGVLKTPKKIQENPRSEKYCLYHKQRGHDTEDCYALQSEIERLIKEGGLGKFLAKARARTDKGKEKMSRDLVVRERSRSPRTGRSNPPIRGVIDMIAGGPTGGDSKTLRKKTGRSLKNPS